MQRLRPAWVEEGEREREKRLRAIGSPFRLLGNAAAAAAAALSRRHLPPLLLDVCCRRSSARESFLLVFVAGFSEFRVFPVGRSFYVKGDLSGISGAAAFADAAASPARGRRLPTQVFRRSGASSASKPFELTGGPALFCQRCHLLDAEWCHSRSLSLYFKCSTNQLLLMYAPVRNNCFRCASRGRLPNKLRIRTASSVLNGPQRRAVTLFRHP